MILMKWVLLLLIASMAVSFGACGFGEESATEPEITDVTYWEAGDLGSRVAVSYPKMKALPGTPGFELNEAIRRRCMEEFDSCREELFPSVGWAKKEIETNPEADGLCMRNWVHNLTYIPDYLSEKSVSLCLMSRWYTGGAHSNWSFVPVNYQWTEKGVRQLDLADLFDPSVDWKVPLSRIVGGKIADIGYCWPHIENAGTELLDAPFTFSSSGLTFHYAPYILTAFAGGDFHIQVPIRGIRHLLSKDGPMGCWLD